jgi:tetratricopeptide (TPR) repeat protein
MGDDIEAGKDCLLSEIERIYRYEWKKTFGTHALALDSLSVFEYIASTLETRGFARQCSENFDGAIDDFTLAVEADGLLFEKASALRRRGHCLLLKGSFKPALVDFQAALAALDPLERPLKSLHLETWSDCQQYMFRGAVLQAKQEKSDTRPLFSKKQRYKIGEALRAGLYDVRQFCCADCGSKNIPNACEAGFCSRCELVCFCSAECHQKAWKCQLRRKCFRLHCSPYCIHDSDRAAIEELVAYDTHGFHVMVFDAPFGQEHTGRIFEALSNRDVYFLPSELDLVPEDQKESAERFITEKTGVDQRVLE